MRFNRRKFLIGAATFAGASSVWLGLSQSRAARVLRMILADNKRRPLAATVKPDVTKWSDNAVTICWIGHATLLINFYGIPVLSGLETL